METIRLVDDSALSVTATLRELGIPRRMFSGGSARPGPGCGRVRPVIVSPLSRRAMQRRQSSTTWYAFQGLPCSHRKGERVTHVPE